MKNIVYSFVAASALLFSSCSDFLDRAPQDALSPSTFWSTESDAELALTGCYYGLESILGGYNMIYWDTTSDNYFNNFSWEGYKPLQTGNITNTSTGTSFFSFTDIRSCNEYLENEANVNWKTAGLEAQYKAEVRAIRAFLFFWKSELYGDFPLITNTFDTLEDSKVGRDKVEDVRNFFITEMEAALPDLPNKSASVQGHFNKQFVQGLLMRYYLYRNDWANALKWANEIRNSGEVSIPATSYADCFLTANQYDAETIMTHSYIASTNMDLYAPPFVSNGISGWSSVVPTLDLMDAFECIDGKTIDESPLYNAENPFVNRDPRLLASLVVPGQAYPGYATCYNSMPQAFADGSSNPDYCNNAGNASKSGLQLGKYFQAKNIDPNSLSSITLHFKLMRYAEILLTIAECEIEQNSNLADAIACINIIRERAGMPKVDESVYNNQAKLRELVRRERRIELNGEGLRRADLLRWGELVSKLAGFRVDHLDGDVVGTTPNAEGLYDVKVTGRTTIYKDYVFRDHNVLLPIYQNYIDINPKLTQNPGY